MPTEEQIAEEALRVRKVRQLVDIASALITQSNMTRDEADTLVRGVRERVLSLFPDGEPTYELLYAPRFRRLIDEATRAPRPGVVIPSIPTKR